MTMRPRRWVLATPATKEWMVDKAAASGADVVFLDLEDAVVPAAKEDARKQAVEGLTSRDWGAISFSAGDALARRHLEAVEQGEATGQGAVGLDGVLVDAVHLRWARQVLAQAKQEV